jgi:hypothetical protein
LKVPYLCYNVLVIGTNLVFRAYVLASNNDSGNSRHGMIKNVAETSRIRGEISPLPPHADQCERKIDSVHHTPLICL